MSDKVSLDEAWGRVFPVIEGADRHISAGRGTHARPATAASLGLEPRLREQPIDGGGAHLQKEAMELLPILDDPMSDCRWQKQRDHLLEALRAEPVRQIPQSQEGLPHIGTVGGATASAAPSRDRFPAQKPDRMLPMIPCQFDELIENAPPFFPRTVAIALPDRQHQLRTRSHADPPHHCCSAPRCPLGPKLSATASGSSLGEAMRGQSLMSLDTRVLRERGPVAP